MLKVLIFNLCSVRPSIILFWKKVACKKSPCQNFVFDMQIQIPRLFGGSLDGARVYVTLFPCNECAKAIIQSGMKEVIYMQDKYAGSDTTKASKKMFDMAGVKYRQFVPKGQTIEVDL